ncbi:unnamed protein product [Linum trigynum]|uniref:Uncharacterized protein n=1 Tax=Linum trigynum TaxID=586398 RepID=A0AAV2CFL6_9ROSI
MKAAPSRELQTTTNEEKEADVFLSPMNSRTPALSKTTLCRAAPFGQTDQSESSYERPFVGLTMGRLDPWGQPILITYGNGLRGVGFLMEKVDMSFLCGQTRSKEVDEFVYEWR